MTLFDFLWILGLKALRAALFSSTGPRYPLHHISFERSQCLLSLWIVSDCWQLLESKSTDPTLGRSDWRMYLNNYLQGRYGHTRNLSWSHTQSGPSHDTRWLAVAYCKPYRSILSYLNTDGWSSTVNGVEYGRGVARDRGTAMEIAAETTYRALTSYYN